MKIIIARTIKGDIWSHGIAKILKTNDADPIYWEFQLFFHQDTTSIFIFFFSVEIGLVGILHFCVKGEQRETQNFE